MHFSALFLSWRHFTCKCATRHNGFEETRQIFKLSLFTYIYIHIYNHNYNRFNINRIPQVILNVIRHMNHFEFEYTGFISIRNIVCWKNYYRTTVHILKSEFFGGGLRYDETAA